MPRSTNARRFESIPSQRRPPAPPKPDFQQIFLEPHFSNPDAAEPYTEQRQDDPIRRR